MKILIKELRIETSCFSWSHGEKQVQFAYMKIPSYHTPHVCYFDFTVRDAALFFQDITVKAMIPAAFSPLR